MEGVRCSGEAGLGYCGCQARGASWASPLVLQGRAPSDSAIPPRSAYDTILERMKAEDIIDPEEKPYEEDSDAESAVAESGEEESEDSEEVISDPSETAPAVMEPGVPKDHLAPTTAQAEPLQLSSSLVATLPGAVAVGGGDSRGRSH